MDRIKVVAKSGIKEGCTKKYQEIAFELIEETRKENGLISYELYQDIENPNIITFIEKWENKEVLDAHIQSKHFKRLVPQLTELRVEGDVDLYRLIK